MRYILTAVAVAGYAALRLRRAMLEITASREESSLLADRLVAEADERRLAEHRAERESALRETVLSGIQDAVIATDQRGIIRYANAAACRVLECEVEDCVGYPLCDMLHILDERTGQQLEPLAYEVLRNGRALHDEEARTLLRKSGSRVPLEVSAYPILDSRGDVVGSVSIIRDIQERRKAERALRQSEERFRLAAEAANLGVWMWDPRTNKSAWSESLSRILGLGDEPYTGPTDRFFEAVAEEDRARVKEELRLAAEAKSVFYSEFRVATPAGESKWLIGHGRGVYDNAGELTTFAGVNIDITERRLAEDRIQALNRDLEGLAIQLGMANDDLKRQTEELQRVNLEKSKFLSSMSHELRTPLNTICGFVELLLEQDAGPLNDRQLRYLRNIESSAFQLLRVVNDVLDLSRIAAGRLDFILEGFDLCELVHEVCSSFQPMAEEHQVGVEIQAETGIRLVADRGRTRQILDNLVSNAIKFTPAGGKVKVQCETGSAAVEFCVVDTGVGIPQAAVDRIFTEFEQVHQDGFRPKLRGSGLGLAVTRKLVELQGGSIEVESEVGKGSTFRIRLPQTVTGLTETEGPA